MAEFYIRELKTGNVFKVYDVKIIDGKTMFLVYNNFWKWVLAGKTELVENNNYWG